MRATRILTLATIGLVLSSCILVSSCIIVDGKPYGIDFDHDKVYGSGHRAEEQRSIEDFHTIRLTVPADANVRVGEATSLELSGDDDLLHHVETTVRDGVLVVDIDDRYRFREGLDLEITTPALIGFEIEGSGDVNITGVKSDRFDLSIEGSGDMSATGEVQYLHASIEGSGDLKLQELSAREASVSIEGSGDIRVRVSESLHYSIEGSGDIRYHGSPDVSGGIEGSGNVTRG